MLQVGPDRPETHEVDRGDSLWNIAREYGLSVDDIRDWNRLEDDRIRPGQELALYPWLTGETDTDPGDPDPSASEILVAAASPLRPAATPRTLASGYSGTSPRAGTQLSISYAEESTLSVEESYRRGRDLIDDLERRLASHPPLGSSLAGWTIVLDPGHGGRDPGAIVATRDGAGRTVYVTEDEYAYDVTVRLYGLLRRHGADVHLTLLSPNHHIRSTAVPTRTFVHEKNEVWNDGGVAARPAGNREDLEYRKRLASGFFNGSPTGRRLFISIHADNSPALPEAGSVLYWGADDSEKAGSRGLARVLAEAMGRDSFVKEQELRVLDGNPADAAALVEVRNLHYDRNSWALRFDELRQSDAEKILRGILRYTATH